MNPRISCMSRTSREERRPIAVGLFGRPLPPIAGLPVLVTRKINNVRHVEPMLFWRKG